MAKESSSLEDLRQEFSEKNTVTFDSISPGSGIKRWWTCNLGHSWEASPLNRTSHGSGCPVCAGRVILAGFNDLATQNSELSKSWGRKNAFSPDSVAPFSHKKVWWECDEGHEWEEKISNRNALNYGCPYCSGKRTLKGWNDLETRYPGIAKEWSSKNKLPPSSFGSASKTKVWWECSKGHEWETEISSRVYGNTGCPVCHQNKPTELHRTVASFAPEIAKEWDSDNILLPTQVARGDKNNVGWVCGKGHKWKASPSNRIGMGSGCPHCASKISKMETEVADFVKELLLHTTPVLTSIRNVIPPKELDIYLPDKKIAIEFNGLFWHTEDRGKNKTYHHSKWKECHEKGIQLIQIWEDQWRDNPDIVKLMLAHKLGVSQEPKTYGKQTEVSRLTKDEALKFLKDNHIQGAVYGSYYLGLKMKSSVKKKDYGQLVAVMVLKRQGEDMLLARYATSTHVVGGQSKLVRYVERTFEYRNLITFADLEVSNGNLYEVTGFIKDKYLQPDYRYLYEGQRQHKFRFRLERFRKDPKLKYEDGMSERDLAKLNGIPRIWDSGKIRYIKPRPPTSG